MAEHKLVMIHGLAFLLLLVTWLSGISIADHADTPMVALYYVMHIFPGSVIFVLILFQWQISSQTRRHEGSGEPFSSRLTHILHKCYDAILVAVPLIGLLIFFEPASPKVVVKTDKDWVAQLMQNQPFHHMHAWLFYLLLGLVVINIFGVIFRKQFDAGE